MAAVSAVVALAFALFPVLAQAGDSAGAQYQDRLPTATGNGPDNNGGNGGSQDQNSDSSGSGNGGSAAGGAGGGGSPPPSGPSGSPGSQAGNGSSATNPGTGGQASASRATAPGSVKLGQNAADVQSSNGDDGGSSPLAGILVGLGLGAIVSVIFVVLRARRQRGQSEPVHSPNAG
jgi:hypothetical protein